MSQKPSRRPSAIENVWWYVREYHEWSRDVISWILETVYSWVTAIPNYSNYSKQNRRVQNQEVSNRKQNDIKDNPSVKGFIVRKSDKSSRQIY